MNAVLRTEFLGRIIAGGGIEQITAYGRIAFQPVQRRAVRHCVAVVGLCVVGDLLAVRGQKRRYHVIFGGSPDIVALADGKRSSVKKVAYAVKSGDDLSRECTHDRLYWLEFLLLSRGSRCADVKLIQKLVHFQVGEQAAYSGAVRLFQLAVTEGNFKWNVPDDSCQPLAFLC